MTLFTENAFPQEPLTANDADAPPGPVLEWVLQRVRLRARRRVAWLRKIWTEAGGDAPADFHSEVDGYLDNADAPGAEAAWLAGQAEGADQLAGLEDALARDQHSRLALLRRIFGLSPVEVDVLQACLAIALEPNLGRVYAYLQDHSGRSYATGALVARLFGHGRCLQLSAGSPLKAWEMVVENDTGRGEPARLECDQSLLNWLLGMDDLDESLAGIARAQPFRAPLSNWPVDPTAGFVTSIGEGHRHPVRVLVAGAEGSGRRSFAAAVAYRLGLPLLAIDSDRIAEPRWPQVFMRAQRQAYLSGCTLVWYGKGVLERHWPRHVPAFAVQFVAAEVDTFMPPEEGLVDHRVELPAIPPAERRRLWLQLVPAAAGWPEAEREALLRMRQTSIGQIVAAAATGAGSVAEVTQSLRTAAQRRLGNLAQPLNSAFGWEDLVVSGALRRGLEDFAFEANERALLWERPEAQRLFPQGRGLVALFTGPPGTGKTMAAQVVAGALGLDLFRIDLSTLVSKYVGETSKNIERVLSRAQRMDVVLLFDEADALFGKRTEVKDAHDRYANTDTNYLLQAIEQYPGISILTSNKKGNIDAGFTRRLRYVLEFARPDARERLHLWRRVTRELAGAEQAATLDNDLGRLAEMLELTGAQIKQATLSALFMARQQSAGVALPHLLRGLERELAKEGRGLGRPVYQQFNC